MQSTNALRRNNDESETKPKANRCLKWKHILKPICDEKDLYAGNGIPFRFPPSCYHVNLLHLHEN